MDNLEARFARSVPFFSPPVSYKLCDVRILHISSAKSYGGAERHVVSLCRELRARGHEVFVALRPTNEWQDRLTFLPSENFLHTSIRNSFGMLSVRSIARFIERGRIDIVHAHIARDYMAASIAVRSARNVKLVLTRHAASPLKPFYRFAISNLETAIAVSPAIEAELVKVFPRGKVRVIPNGFDAGTPADDDLSAANGFRRLIDVPDGAPLVAAIGELTLQKGQRDLVLAANEVVKQIPNAHFVLVGEDHAIDQHFRRELKRLVKVLGLEGHFHWLNDIGDVAPLISAVDILVSPVHTGGPGPAILDAMAAGKAVIATDTEGAREIIPLHDALTPVKDPIVLADKICKYLADDQMRYELGVKLQTSVLERFGIREMTDATEAAYRDVIKGR